MRKNLYFEQVPPFILMTGPKVHLGLLKSSYPPVPPAASEEGNAEWDVPCLKPIRGSSLSSGERHGPCLGSGEGVKDGLP